MKIETFQKRFRHALDHILGSSTCIIPAKNGKMYQIRINKKGEPIAKELNKK